MRVRHDRLQLISRSEGIATLPERTYEWSLPSGLWSHYYRIRPFLVKRLLELIKIPIDLEFVVSLLQRVL